VGGWITDHYSWHWLFFINLLPGIFITLTVPRLVRIDLPDWSLFRRADYPGILLMSLFLGCLEYTLEEGPRWDWMSDPVIATTAWVAAVSGVLFVWRSLAAAEPVVDLRALKERNFALGCFFPSSPASASSPPSTSRPCSWAGASVRCRSGWRCFPPGCSRSCPSRSMPG
jgi:DHA2 family multidrug resistance protein